MAAYFNSNHLRSSLQDLVKIYINECRECDMLSQDCMDLLKHNFLADFVAYNKNTENIEIGIRKNNDFDRYPEIEVYSFPLDEIGKKVEHSFKNNNEDLEFYGKLVGRRKGIGSNTVVLLD